MSTSGTSGTVLSQGFGYGIILGLGAAFALGMIFTTWALKRYHNEVQTSEAFSTAGRTVKSGLVSSNPARDGVKTPGQRPLSARALGKVLIGAPRLPQLL